MLTQNKKYDMMKRINKDFLAIYEEIAKK